MFGYLKYIANFWLRNLYKARIELINAELLNPQMPRVKHGVLYLDGEGTATAAVAKRAAELFNEGAYDCVVMAGGVKPSKDWKSKFVFKKVLAEGLPLPLNKEDTEADYSLYSFQKYADPEKFQDYSERGLIHVISKGGNAGAKVAACKEHFEKADLVQVVSLAYTIPRLIGTIVKEVPEAIVTGERVFPFGLTEEGWSTWFISYATVMQEADKSGPRTDGKKPAYEDKFFTRVDLDEMGMRAQKMDKRLGL